MISAESLGRLIEASVLLQNERNLRPNASTNRQQTNLATTQQAEQDVRRPIAGALRNLLSQSALPPATELIGPDEPAATAARAQRATNVYTDVQQASVAHPDALPAPTSPSVANNTISGELAQLISRASGLVPTEPDTTERQLRKRSITRGWNSALSLDRNIILRGAKTWVPLALLFLAAWIAAQLL